MAIFALPTGLGMLTLKEVLIQGSEGRARAGLEQNWLKLRNLDHEVLVMTFVYTTMEFDDCLICVCTIMNYNRAIVESSYPVLCNRCRVYFPIKYFVHDLIVHLQKI